MTKEEEGKKDVKSLKDWEPVHDSIGVTPIGSRPESAQTATTDPCGSNHIGSSKKQLIPE